ncbi:MAG: acyl--CoA ligase [Rhodospirillaceae bacterium]|jgi:long-chain acyl-CoA synthetase|nr:acyl--CoA ligase [Rhodospirillaceae bacterium]
MSNRLWVTDDRWGTRDEVHYGDRVVRCYKERPANLDQMFRNTVANNSDAPAMVMGHDTVDYGTLDNLVNNMAGNLANLGVVKGDRVALLLGNRFEFITATMACARIGVISVPMNIRQQARETEFILNQCGAKVVLHEASLSDVMPEPIDIPAVEHVFAAGDEPTTSKSIDELAEPATPPEVEVSEEDIATILYTSGTTGRPKGATLTHFGHIHSLLHFEHCMQLRPGDKTILAVPASHVTGLVAIILSMVNVGGCTVMMKEFRARAYLELAAREQISMTILVPAMYNLCLLDPEFASFDLSAWRIGGFGGAPMPKDTIARLADQLPNLVLMNAYGATETTSPTTMMPLGQTSGHEDSIGQVVPCGGVRIMDDDGREVPAGESGEIWIAGPMIVPGYWDNPDANAKEFTNGWWHSGDIGSLDEDGFVRIFDRKKDMINRAGFKVYSAEVESVMSFHPEIIELAIVGRPDPVLGEKVQAFVVSTPELKSVEELRTWCATQMSNYKVPDFVTFLDDPLPRNANGKILKRNLRDLIDAEMQEAASA